MTLMADNAAQRTAKREVIVDFSADALRAPFALRCGSFFIDYILVVAVPVLGLVFSLLIDDNPAKASNNTTWLIAFLVGISDLIIFPALSGQTLGMMICGLRIVTPDGRDASAGRVILRNTAGYLLTAITLGVGFLMAAVTPTRRALHDYVSGTMVVYGRKRRL
jgi:uncharacterized RDD family membrane protein YckC